MLGGKPNECDCECHSKPGIMHFEACCSGQCKTCLRWFRNPKHGCVPTSPTLKKAVETWDRFQEAAAAYRQEMKSKFKHTDLGAFRAIVSPDVQADLRLAIPEKPYDLLFIGWSQIRVDETLPEGTIHMVGLRELIRVVDEFERRYGPLPTQVIFPKET